VWLHLQALFLKTADSVSLPIYQVLPDAPAKIEA
jgi:ribosome biogenesis protein UTP30